MSELYTYTNNCTTGDFSLASMKTAMMQAALLRAEMLALPEHIELHPTTETDLMNHPSVVSARVTTPEEYAFGRHVMGMPLYRDYSMPPHSWREHYRSGKRVMHYASGLVVRCNPQPERTDDERVE